MDNPADHMPAGVWTREHESVLMPMIDRFEVAAAEGRHVVALGQGAPQQ